MKPTARSIANRTAWVKRRRTARRVWVGFTLLFAVLFLPDVWLTARDSRQWLQEAAQYKRDCSDPAAASAACRLRPLQVSERRKEGSPAPDDDTHFWLGLQDKSGQRFEVDTSRPQWDRLEVGASVTATVWNGEVEEVTDSGGTARMRTNPVLRSGDARLSLTGLESLGWAVSLGLCLGLFLFTWTGRRQEEEWRLGEAMVAAIRPGNERGAK